MNVMYKESLLTVDTGILTKDIKREGKLTLVNEKGQIVYTVEMGETSEISKFGMICSHTSANKTAVVKLLQEDGTTEEEVKATYGRNLVTADRSIYKITANQEAYKSIINDIFTNGENQTAPIEEYVEPVGALVTDEAGE